MYGDAYKGRAVFHNLTKNTNDAIYYSVNEIVTAIGQGKRIKFLYFDYDCEQPPRSLQASISLLSSEIFGDAECEIIHFMNCEILLPLVAT